MDFSNFWWQAANAPTPPTPGDTGNSLRFRGGQSLTGQTGGSGTASVWIKRGNLGVAQTVMPGIAFAANDTLNGSTGVFRDPSAWMHVVVSTNGTFVNGVSVGSGSAISAGNIGASCELFLARFHFIDGQALDPTDFGAYDANGVWTPKEYTGTYGTNGFHLDFSDPADIGADRSGNGNDFTPTGFDTAPVGIWSDHLTTNGTWVAAQPPAQCFDGSDLTEGTSNAPTGQNCWIEFAPTNPISITGQTVHVFTYSAGATYTLGGATTAAPAIGWTTVDKGTATQISATSPLRKTQDAVDTACGISVVAIGGTQNQYWLADNTGEDYDLMLDSPTQNYATINPLYPGASTTKANLNTANTTGKPTILGIAGNVSVGGASVAWDGTEAGWNSSGSINFGQQPNGFDNFSTAELPAAPIPNGRDHFQAITDTGANILTAAQTAFPNGLWWIKDRVNSNQHQFVDSVRGGDLALNCPASGPETAYGAPAGSSVAWCWNAPEVFTPTGTNLTNLSGKRNVAAGFSIVTATGSNIDPSSFTHGLTQQPEFVISKSLDASYDWGVYHIGLTDAPGPTNYMLRLNSDTSEVDRGSMYWDLVTNPGSVTMGSYGENASNASYVYYCWHSVPGYSAFGSFTGNSSADGPMILTGFRPAWICYKVINQNNDWQIIDTNRDPINNNTSTVLRPNRPDGDNTNLLDSVDILSNGFKIRDGGGFNSTGWEISYACFAENPFGGDNIAPATAR